MRPYMTTMYPTPIDIWPFYKFVIHSCQAHLVFRKLYYKIYSEQCVTYFYDKEGKKSSSRSYLQAT